MKSDPKSKKASTQVEKHEEKVHRDLDGDGEKAEPREHQIKVLGKKVADKLDKTDEKKAPKKSEPKKPESKRK